MRSMPSGALPRALMASVVNVRPYSSFVPSVLTRYFVSRFTTSVTPELRTVSYLESSGRPSPQIRYPFAVGKPHARWNLFMNHGLLG